MQTSWCQGIRNGNANHPFTDSEASLIDAHIIKMSRGRYHDLTDKAILVVRSCYEKFPDDLPSAESCVQEATTEFVKRASTCKGLPTKDGTPFSGKGPAPGKQCKVRPTKFCCFKRVLTF